MLHSNLLTSCILSLITVHGYEGKDSPNGQTTIYTVRGYGKMLERMLVRAGKSLSAIHIAPSFGCVS